jgi:hypothetical protein
MSTQAYYFVNHSRREFSFFTKHISITKTLSDAIINNIGWSATDDIRIESEGYNDTKCLEYLDNLKYTMAKIN